MTGTGCSPGQAEAVQLIHSQQNPRRTNGLQGREAGKGQMQMEAIKQSNISGAVSETLYKMRQVYFGSYFYPGPHVQALHYLFV